LFPLPPAPDLPLSIVCLDYETIHIPRPSLQQLASNATIQRRMSERRRSDAQSRGLTRGTATQQHTAGVVGEDMLATGGELLQPAAPLHTKESDTRTLGTYTGVFARCLQTILGLIMLIRLPWIVGQSGILGTLLIIAITMGITAVTALSMSAICSNGVLPAGGVYLILSRSLGAEIGVSTAVLFMIANGLSVSLYAVGLAETVSTMLRLEFDYDLLSDAVNEVRLFGTILSFAVLLVCFFGFKWIIRSELLLLLLLLLSHFWLLTNNNKCQPTHDVRFVSLSLSLSLVL
jgi:hypothetical protein